MADNKGDTPKMQQQQQQQQHPLQPQPQQISSSSPTDPLEDSGETRLPPPLLHHPIPTVVAGQPFNISPPIFVPSSVVASSTFDQFEPAVNPKRPRFGQWKLLTSPKQPQQMAVESCPSPTPNPTSLAQPHTATASSSDTTSSPTQSPIPSFSAGQETNKPEASSAGDHFHHHHHPQFRKGKYVSPVWKPNEMLWLARAWRIQYQGGSFDSDGVPGQISGGEGSAGSLGRSKTRAEKDREVAEFLNLQGVNRDAKTAGTKWDNMLGEFRKVYEWERGGEREQVGKSYFRLSPYERKIHRLPASFDEEVFEELSQFMGPRMRNPQTRIFAAGDDGRALVVATGRNPPPPPPFKVDDDQLPLTARAKQLGIGHGVETFYHHGTARGGLLGYELPQVDTGGLSSKELRRIGKIRMTWEESVSLWAEEGEPHRGRVRVQGSTSFLNADELTFFDESLVACPMEAFEDGPYKGFSVDRFIPGQQVKVFGRRKSFFSSSTSERIQLPFAEPVIKSVSPWELQDPTEYYVGCLRVPPPSLPSLVELSWYLQEPPPEELRFPIQRDVYRDLPQGKESFFTTSHEPLDCRSIMFDIVSPIIRNNPSISAGTAMSRDSFIGLWDDCINRVVAKFCSVEVVMTRKPSLLDDESVAIQDRWPNVTGFVRNFCIWRGEEADRIRETHANPSTSIVEKLLWTYGDIPYILGYYAVGYSVTFCVISRASGPDHNRVVRTDLYTIDLSCPSDRLKCLVPCYRVAGLLALLGDRCFNNTGNYKLLPFPYSDFERRVDSENMIVEMTPNTVTRIFPTKQKWAAVKEIYDFIDQRVPHAEFLHRAVEIDLAIVFKPRGVRLRPVSAEELVEALMCVTKAMVALHDLSFMHRDLSWEKVMRRGEEWVVSGFDEAAAAPQIVVYPRGGGGGEVARGCQAPEMGRGMHGVKVDVWGVGHLVKTCGLPGGALKMLRELQNRCLDPNPENRPTAADCYHHLLQLQSSLHSATAATASGTASGY